LSFLFSVRLVALILDITPASVRNYRNNYKKGGIEALKKNNHKGRRSSLHVHIHSIEDEFDKSPPASIKEAVARIEKLTKVKRSLKSVRHFLKTYMNFHYRKVASIPAKANAKKQKAFLDKQLNPLLKNAKNGKNIVLFVDAAHFVHGAFLGFLWSVKRVFVKTPSGRKRYNVLGAVNAITHKLHYICNETYVNAQTVCDLLKNISQCYPGKIITLVMDNAKYQRCSLVLLTAKKMKIKLLFLPPYSPNLNIIERLWKFIKKESLNSKYYEKFSEFKAAIVDALEKSNGEWKQKLKTLLVLKFQMFSIENEKEAA
jgi:transposase